MVVTVGITIKKLTKKHRLGNKIMLNLISCVFLYEIYLNVGIRNSNKTTVGTNLL